MILRDEFWNKKIESWERAKYAPSSFSFFDPNASLKNRQKIARAMLAPVVQGRTVVELGCGTGLLMPEILAAGAKKYIGVDISKKAIARAQQRAKHKRLESQVELIEGDICQLSLAGDVCFSLGVLDWLTLEEIQATLTRIRSRFYLHSFSEKRSDLQQAIHKVYVYLSYGYKDSVYVPRYYSAAEISEVMTACSLPPPRFFRSRAMSFGCFAKHLDEK